MADFLVDQLQDEAERWHNEQLGVESTGINGVVRSERLLGEDVLARLRELSTQLEESTPFKDWHPKSNEQILDVVHPSLYPLVDGVTRVLPEDEAVTFPLDSRDLTKWFTSKQADVFIPPRDVQQDLAPDADMSRQQNRDLFHTFQWLPTDFELDESGTRARALSYINNLHPDPTQPSGQLYDVIENVLAAFVPMFEATLSEAMTGMKGARKEFRDGHRQPFWVEYSWDPPNMEDVCSDSDSDEGYGRYCTDVDAQWRETREWVPIPVLKYQPERIVPITIKGRTLQVIVKMATIHLTPEKPVYEGGSWHVEGTKRENICATGILYLDQDNIIPSSLQFRGVADSEPFGLKRQDDDVDEAAAIEMIYGLVCQEDATQYYGSIPTKAGLALSFPNGVQHRVTAFKLADPTRPGYRKILAFFLCNPLKRVISTSRVSPQRFDWIESSYAGVRDALLTKLPAELVRMILPDASPNGFVPRLKAHPDVDVRPRVRKVHGGTKRRRSRRLYYGEEDDGYRIGFGYDYEPRTGATGPSGDTSPGSGAVVDPDAEEKRVHDELWKSSGMTLDEARAWREELMRERAAQTDHLEDRNMSAFAFCEH
ncbi:hypothetical protein OC842_007526 [Tilletia horrida]|uniref:DUF4246 domain-containing protein n=1 Tax=Tilletia horrida TaxID=155126 RepID=A0AAN6G869_9BASI|nr:hypothetical protein OC842_007526 [Tilletia horrida]